MSRPQSYSVRRSTRCWSPTATLAVFAALLVLTGIAQPRAPQAQTLVFGSNQLIDASMSATRNERPRVEVTDDGNAHILWASGPFGSEVALLATSPPGGSYGLAQELSSGPGGVGVDAGAGPTLRTRGNHLVAGWENHSSGIFAARSTNMGVTWESPIRADSQSAETRYLQSVGVFADGRMSQSWLAFAGGGLLDPGVAWTVQDAQGVFIEPIEATAVSPEEGCVCCSPDQLILDDDQTVLVAFRNNEHNIREIHVVRSVDGGVTFPQDIRIDTTGWQLFGCPSTGAHLAADGSTVLAAWKSAANDAAHIWLSRSEDSGDAWSPVQQLDATNGTFAINYPQVAIRGSLAVAVWEGNNAEQKPAIFARASNDAGITWGPVVQVNDPADPWILRGHPSVAIFANSEIEVAWKDARLGSARIFHARGTVSAASIAGSAPPALTTLRLTTAPNPTRPSTQFTFDLTRSGLGNLAIFDASGRQRALVASGTFEAGHHEIPWHGRDELGQRLPAGVYFARLLVPGVTRGIDKIVIPR